jgi:signal transduction histidine kinase
MADPRRKSSAPVSALTDAVLRSLSHDLKEPIRSIRKRIDNASDDAPSEAYLPLTNLDIMIEDIATSIKNFRQVSKVVEINFQEIETFILSDVMPKVEDFSDLLDSLSPELMSNSGYRANLGLVDKHFRRFRRRVATIYDYARARGAIKLTSFGLHNEVRRVIRDMERLFRDHDATLQIRGNASVTADQIKIALALQNLFENAIKYRGKDTPPNIRVVIHNLDLGAPAHPRNLAARIPCDRKKLFRYWTFLEVHDNGRGVSKEDEARLFEMFFRSRESFEAGDEGSGLGLSIVQEIVRTHGGIVGVESKLGEGSSFWFALPQASAQV